MATNIKTFERVVAVCPKCNSVIGDGGLCSYDCNDDATYKRDREKVTWRTYRITEELVKETTSKPVVEATGELR